MEIEEMGLFREDSDSDTEKTKSNLGHSQTRGGNRKKSKVGGQL